jgi:hypothetical protein
MTPAPTPPPKDLTAILLPKGQLTDEEVRRVVAGFGDALVRVAPLDAVGLVQVEAFELGDGLPRATPELVARLAERGRAVFVHANHSAQQGLLHAFYPSGPQPGFAGAPGPDLDARLRDALGVTLAEITAADDGSRLGVGVAATRTVAVARGRTLAVPPGMPTDLGIFSFHDRGHDLDEAEPRLALFAFDAAEVARRWASTPGRELAAMISAAPSFGPLDGARPAVVEALAALGDRTPAAAELRDVRAYELCALDEGRAFAGGDLQEYWDARVLPLFALGDGDPVIGAADVEDLDDCASVLHALVEVMPYAAPPGGEGSMLASISDGELGPLAPWARGSEYTGTVFTVASERLLGLVRGLDGDKLRARVERLERAWYRAARPGQPEGDALTAFMRAHADEGKDDLERLTRGWAELRALLELAALNKLQTALVFYEGA